MTDERTGWGKDWNADRRDGPGPAGPSDRDPYRDRDPYAGGGYDPRGGHDPAGSGAGIGGQGAGARLFDDLARLATDAAGAAQGFRREAETVMRSQMEGLLARMDVVRRDEFEAMAETARRARAESEALRTELDALKARLDALDSGGGGPADGSS